LRISVLALLFSHSYVGVGGCETGGAGSFPRIKREVFGGTKIQVFEFGVEHLNFSVTYLSFGANFVTVYLNFSAIYLNFGTKLENGVFSMGVGGGVGGSARTSFRFRHRCREKIFRPPLAISTNCIASMSPPRGLGHPGGQPRVNYAIRPCSCAPVSPFPGRWRVQAVRPPSWGRRPGPVVWGTLVGGRQLMMDISDTNFHPVFFVCQEHVTMR